MFALYFFQIRLQYDEYPEHTEQASRLVVLVQDVEIRDRLAHSQINKFLYQYTSEACPKQSHANMVRDLTKLIYCSIVLGELYVMMKCSVISFLRRTFSQNRSFEEKKKQVKIRGIKLCHFEFQPWNTNDT